MKRLAIYKLFNVDLVRIKDRVRHLQYVLFFSHEWFRDVMLIMLKRKKILIKILITSPSNSDLKKLCKITQSILFLRLKKFWSLGFVDLSVILDT